MTRRAFTGGFIGATVAPVLPVATAFTVTRYQLFDYELSEVEMMAVHEKLQSAHIQQNKDFCEGLLLNYIPASHDLR